MAKIFTPAEKKLVKDDYIDAAKNRDRAIEAIQAVRIIAKIGNKLVSKDNRKRLEDAEKHLAKAEKEWPIRVSIAKKIAAN